MWQPGWSHASAWGCLIALRRGRVSGLARAASFATSHPNRSPIPHSITGAFVIETRKLAAACAWLADQKKGEEIRVYDVCEQVKFADYFVVITGTSRPHVRAMYDEVHYRLKAAGQTHARAEGVDLGWWILTDFGDVVVHILQPEAREFYGLDDLYGDCEQLDWQSEELPPLPAEKV